jgi:NADH:ubiquinone oxidoreductase subunit 5 (subunit L)/multisubunit Na+/H+ antiporter MnhA subunit
VSLQFWLPRAIAAPTQVWAYLHSAAMVAGGVLLIGLVYPSFRTASFYSIPYYSSSGSSRWR